MLKQKRQNMERCEKVYGKIMLFVAMESNAYSNNYGVAQDSLKCYVKSTDYELKIVDVFKDERVSNQCPHKNVFYRKHCAVASYLNETDWMMVLDADTGVVNPNHCIEEYVDQRVNIIFYERFFNWEIASGNYLVKNSDFSKDFLMRWANFEFLNAPDNDAWWSGYDNGAIHAVFLETLFSNTSQEYKNCEKIWFQARDYDTYMPFVICARVYLGAQRIWPDKMKLLHRAHGMVRDWYSTYDSWWDADFMIHGWKRNTIGDDWPSPFEKMFNISECGNNYDGWHWRADKRLNVTMIREMLRNDERGQADALIKLNLSFPFLSEPDVGLCYPNCQHF